MGSPGIIKQDGYVLSAQYGAPWMGYSAAFLRSIINCAIGGKIQFERTSEHYATIGWSEMISEDSGLMCMAIVYNDSKVLLSVFGPEAAEEATRRLIERRFQEWWLDPIEKPVTSSTLHTLTTRFIKAVQKAKV